MIFIFRNQGNGWRILQMDPNASVPFVGGVRETEPPSLLRTFDELIVSGASEAPPPPAVLIAPSDRAVLTRFPRPEIAWRSEGPTGSAFIVESQYWEPGGEGNWSVSNLTFANRFRSDQPFRQRAPFGVGMQPHRWRIWTLVPSGAVSLSSWRTVLFSN